LWFNVTIVPAVALMPPPLVTVTVRRLAEETEQSRAGERDILLAPAAVIEGVPPVTFKVGIVMVMDEPRMPVPLRLAVLTVPPLIVAVPPLRLAVVTVRH